MQETIFLVNNKLPPILQFMSGVNNYSEIIDKLWSCCANKFEICHVDGFDCRNGLFINSKYFIEPEVLQKWIMRLNSGYINVEIFNGQELVFSYHSSRYAISKTYSLETINGINSIDYSFVKKRFQTFRSRSKNEILLIGDVVEKSSNDIRKILNEYSFIAKNHHKLDFYPPVFNLNVTESMASYQMPLVTPGDVSSYYLEDDLNFFVESRFSKFCDKYFREATTNREQSQEISDRANIKYSEKLRLRMWDRRNDFNEYLYTLSNSGDIKALYLSTLLNDMVGRLEKLFSTGEFEFVDNSPLGLFHGDLCLSNILYDSKLNQFFLIDPRGDTELPACMDLAKLAHSLHGGYDLILSGRYQLILTNDGLNLNIDSNKNFRDFFQLINGRIGLHTIEQIIILEVYLFLTMIKFHKEDLTRCLAFLVRSRDLLAEWEFSQSKNNA
jgi:hypothetical protein